MNTRNNLDSQIKKAIVFYTKNEINKALNLVKKLLQKNPDIAILYSIIGACYVKNKSFDLALVQYKKALTLNPNDPDIYFNLGLLFDECGDLGDAIKAYHKALILRPENHLAHNNLGGCYKSLGKIDLASEHFHNALLFKQDYPEAYFNLGVIALEDNQINSAVKNFKKAIDYKSDYYDAIIQLGISFNRLNASKLAEKTIKKGISLYPKNAEGYFNLGLVYKNLKCFDLEITCYQKAINLKPDYTDANWNLSLVQLLSGKFNEGWSNYAWRFKKEAIFALRKYPKPLWDGCSLINKTLFVYHEQGVGDTLQCVRYVKLLSQQGAKVILGCPPHLLRLMSGIPEINYLTVSERDCPEFDFFIPMMSIPGVLKTDIQTIPNNVPYLYSNKKNDNWLINNSKLLNIGFVWAGNPKHHNDKNRSVDLSFFKPLFALEGAQFYSLQVGERNKDLKLDLAYDNVIDLSTEFKDYEDTASIIQQLDLVITVDTSVAHLAGAMGLPVWVLLPCVPDWRWLLDRSDSPWYPTMRLFRQENPGEWQTVFDEVAFVLNHELKKPVHELRLLKLFWLVINSFKQQNIKIGIYYLSELLVIINTFSQNLPESKIHQTKSILKEILTDLKAQRYSNVPKICEDKLLPLLGLNLSDYLSSNEKFKT